MTITVTGVNQQSITIGDDNRIDGHDNLQELATALGMSDQDLHLLLDGKTFEGTISLETLLAKAVDGDATTQQNDINKLLNKATTLQSAISSLTNTIARNPANKETLEAVKRDLEAELDQAKQLLQNSNGEPWTPDMASRARSLRINPPNSESHGDNSQSPFGNNGTGGFKGASWGQQSQGAQGANTGWRQTSGGAGGNPLVGTNGGINASALNYMNQIDDFKLQGMDDINNAQNRQKMLMLFMYFARNAMSGDVNAMYQFVRFISYIISTDKALQNVWMGTKLIQLQDESRRATQKILDADPGSDMESQNNFAKVMQESRAEENTIATSQKLIAQMMEEFTQVVELMTNVQKSLLDSNGKILSNISVWR